MIIQCVNASKAASFTTDFRTKRYYHIGSLSENSLADQMISSQLEYFVCEPFFLSNMMILPIAILGTF